MQLKHPLATAPLPLAVTLVAAIPSPITTGEPTSLEVLGQDYVSPFNYTIVNALAAAGDYETLEEMYSVLWDYPSASSDYGVCETSGGSPPTDDAHSAVNLLNSRGTCCRWNAVATQCSNLTNRGQASIGFCGAYKACLQCSPFARDRAFGLAFYCAWRDPSGVVRSGGKWMLDGAGPGARLILH
ncbi:hypothetical protein L873DRAFT_1807041 [Choiromyces venosus 120613-1]|uniref:Uncharacterized protein n=1 Tax=Choiromyces venosus 120613-1 TaxID=1336337 RepID=A0A3N4JSN0_9PEZI|nr:hypothetical protein L873DRAFT_1807041 [Choiromyces venosus 120613-1]